MVVTGALARKSGFKIHVGRDLGASGKEKTPLYGGALPVLFFALIETAVSVRIVENGQAAKAHRYQCHQC